MAESGGETKTTGLPTANRKPRDGARPADRFRTGLAAVPGSRKPAIQSGTSTAGP